MCAAFLTSKGRNCSDTRKGIYVDSTNRDTNGYKVVAARTLGRNISTMLSEVQRCPGFVITRHGMPIATLAPIRSPLNPPTSDGEDLEWKPVREALADLGPVEKDALRTLVTPSTPDSAAYETVHAASEIALILSGLELKGLAERLMPGCYRLSQLGRVILALDEASSGNG